MGSGIAQGQQQVKLFQQFFDLLTLHRLRLIYDQNWVGFRNNIDRLTIFNCNSCFRYRYTSKTIPI